MKRQNKLEDIKKRVKGIEKTRKLIKAGTNKKVENPIADITCRIDFSFIRDTLKKYVKIEKKKISKDNSEKLSSKYTKNTHNKEMNNNLTS